MPRAAAVLALTLLAGSATVGQQAPDTATTALPAAPNWPQWRGPDGRGIPLGTDYPGRWSADTNIAWKAPVPGRGHSSPAVWGDRVFLTTAVETGAGPTHEVLQTNPLGEPVYASLALAGGAIYVRGQSHLFAIRDGSVSRP